MVCSSPSFNSSVFLATLRSDLPITTLCEPESSSVIKGVTSLIRFPLISTHAPGGFDSSSTLPTPGLSSTSSVILSPDFIVKLDSNFLKVE